MDAAATFGLDFSGGSQILTIVRAENSFAGIGRASALESHEQMRQRGRWAKLQLYRYDGPGLDTARWF
jgi:hypothetical protein